MDRVLTTHTGSLIRPRALAELMTAGPPPDEAARERRDRMIADAAAEAVSQQVEVGLDVINDGEMGKANWISYLYERVDGIEFRPIARERSTSNLPPSRDRQAFPGFYGEHDAAVDRARREAAAARGEGEEEVSHAWVCTGPLRYDPTAVERDIANLRAAVASADVIDTFLPVVAPASAYWLVNEHYASEEEFVFAVADVLAEEYRHIVDAGIMLQVDDAVLMHECDSVLATGWIVRGLPPLGRAADRGAQPRAARAAPRTGALPRLLGQLARSARLRPAARRCRRSRAQGDRRLLPDRAGQPAPRA